MPDQQEPQNTQSTASTEPTAPAQTTTETPAENNTENVVIDPKEALSTDIVKLIEKARADEKSKQYGKLQRLESEYTAAKNRIGTLEDQLSEITKKLNAEPDTKKTSENKEGETKGTLDADAIDRAIKAAASATLERAEKEIFGPQIAALQAELKETRALDQAREVEGYKNRLLEANKDAIIPELLAGNSKEELDTSLVLAKQAFARTAEILTQRQQTATSNAQHKLPPVPSVNGGTAPATTTEVKSMSHSDYASQREQVLAQASQAAKAALQAQAE